jgi:D-glycero-D-manno-heptose 1,7-bisphosphate phosphatase
MRPVRAAFLDRDGVVIEEIGHLRRREDVRLLPGAALAVRTLHELGFLVIVATNQSVVARGLCTEADVSEIHSEVARQLAAEGAQVDDWLYCPHHPDGAVARYRIDCACRKPKPGMLIEAQIRHGLNLAESFLIGDKISDIVAAHRAGCRAVLVRTGHGAAEMNLPNPDERPEHIAYDLPAAVQWIRGAAGEH